VRLSHGSPSRVLEPPVPSVRSGEENGAAPRGSRPIRVLSNADWFDARMVTSVPIEARRVSGTGVLASLRDFWRARNYDAVVFNGAWWQLFRFCLLRKLVPTWRAKLVSVDLILWRPRGFVERSKAWVKRRLLTAVDLFILYYRDTAELERLYGITADRLSYVPFEVNDYARVLATTTRDEGFILACGRSLRDYLTFGRAMQGLPYKACILATLECLAEHGTADNFLALCPPNVTVVGHDGSSESWIDWMARSSFVVLPILPEAISCAGISTYFVAMALGKCVIITEGPATRGILEDGQAIIVPPSDASALKAAIIAAREDAAYRSRVASAGQRYARALGAHERLARDICREVVRLVAKPEARSDTSPLRDG